jgi:hypothetical protein
MIDVSDYTKAREDTLRYYHTVGRLFCPAFHADVFFTSEGFNHLVYKSGRIERLKESQMMKFRLLPRAVDLVKLTTTYQEYDEHLQEFEVKRFKKRVRESKLVRYWGLIAIIRDFKIKVIVRQVGDGHKHFWSIIPNWTTSQHRDIKLISQMKGDPEDD